MCGDFARFRVEFGIWGGGGIWLILRRFRPMLSKSGRFRVDFDPCLANWPSPRSISANSAISFDRTEAIVDQVRIAFSQFPAKLADSGSMSANFELTTKSVRLGVCSNGGARIKTDGSSRVVVNKVLVKMRVVRTGPLLTSPLLATSPWRPS